MLKSHVHVAAFKEHLIADIFCIEPHEFDVITYNNLPSDFMVDGKFSLHQYCTCLLYKISTLDKSGIKPFLQYQCDQYVDPFTWLNKLEKLIDLNRDLFVTKEQNIKLEKALIVIELLRQEIEHGKYNVLNKFDFNKVQKKARAYDTIEEKLSFLMESKIKYLQDKPLLLNPNELPFDEKIDLEIMLIKSLDELNKRKIETSSENKRPHHISKESIQSPDKFKLNVNLNQFIDIFFQLMNEKKVNGKPFLEASPNELAEMITTWFKDKEGKEISLDTVKTILKPSRFEKRPKGNGRFNIPD